MTLVVALKSQDAIVVAADSRGTVGDPRGLTAINDTQIKIYQAGRCAIAFAGASELGQTLLDGLRQDAYADIDAAVLRVSKAFEESFRGWFKGYSPEQRPAVLLTLAGYRTRRGADPEQMIYMLNSQLGFAPQLYSNNPCMMGVPQYAVYLAHRYYDPSISTERARSLAEYLIAETASQDPKVGGPIHIAEVTPDGYRELSSDEVDAIHEANSQLNVQLRAFFISSGEASS